MSTPTRTLVLHTGALGDFLLACPALRHLAQRGPIELVGHPERHALAVAAGLATRSHPIGALGLHEVFAAPESAPNDPPAKLWRFLEPFDAAHLWMRDPDALLVRTLHAAGVAGVRCAPGLPPDDWEGHAMAYYLHTVDAPAIAPGDFHLDLGSVPDLPSWEVIIQPGSGSPKKNWPVEHFFAVAQNLIARRYRVGWLLGPAEEGCAPPPGVELIREVDLVRLGRILAKASLYIGNDTGTTHLAAMVACPTVAIFSPTDPARWAPRGPHTNVIAGTPWPLPVEVLGFIDHNILIGEA